MASSMKKNRNKHHEQSPPAEEQLPMVDELRAAIGPLFGALQTYCSDACLSRYLRARNWCVKKSEKMLRESIKWRASYKPEAISWEEVAMESETGKVYRANFLDKFGRTVLIMRPSKQNTNCMDGQIKQLVFSMENAILNLPPNQEQMVWLIDFDGWTLSNSVPVKTARETATILQNHYPERLSLAILYNPPRIFEAFWLIVKPVLDPKTYQKVKFVYSKDAESLKLMDQLFDMDKLDFAFGGRHYEDFDFLEYQKRMLEDEIKREGYWNLGSKKSKS
ncbi:hypothetical protein O6H91_21G063700 [Diphasiastrum complanatum]|uniref:Uncharacterized protein n=2 Tax=Diphasiastrum complanatum TaxID=34168 RepID=A0ACC2AL69_DIPCM|nr:hypothetical protein O6H91_21G063700 [Diphasiastrum complanatum]KAJ7518318.1 hypothetical protein O6H91_21G063700 [Diphasiastrum complanatum]